MALAVLELTDIALLLGDGTGTPSRSPGFATLTRDAVVTGAAALAQARLRTAAQRAQPRTPPCRPRLGAAATAGRRGG